jgi:hypothetical protein
MLRRRLARPVMAACRVPGASRRRRRLALLQRFDADHIADSQTTCAFSFICEFVVSSQPRRTLASQLSVGTAWAGRAGGPSGGIVALCTAPIRTGHVPAPHHNDASQPITSRIRDLNPLLPISTTSVDLGSCTWTSNPSQIRNPSLGTIPPAGAYCFGGFWLHPRRFQSISHSSVNRRAGAR